MERVENPELQRQVLKWLADKYKILELRAPNHLSTYIYCRTKAFFDHKQAIEPTESELMLFITGYGLQYTLTPPDIEDSPKELDGVVSSPDIVLPPIILEQLIEVKSTRRSAKNHSDDKAVSDFWLQYMLGNCKIRDTNKYDLVIIYLMGNYSPPFPQLYADTLTFDFEEIELNWAMILEHKAVLDKALETDIMPTPYEHCELWECKGCRYNMMCEVLTREGLTT